MLTQLSTDIADIVARAAASVVQVHGHGRPATGLIHSEGLVVTTGAAVGQDEQPRIRTADGAVLDAQVAGWDPATHLVALRASGLQGPALAPGPLPRVGEIAIAVGRSWSNALTATAGLVSVIGGPLATGRRRAIEQVIRTSAPMHRGFAGGALLGADGGLLGVATAASIRGLGVVIPAGLAWNAVTEVLQRATLKRGYVGIAVQPAGVSDRQKPSAGVDRALLVVGVKSGSPADEAGLLVGDLLLTADGQALATPEELLDLLVGERVGRRVVFTVLRATAVEEVGVAVLDRQDSAVSRH